MFDYVQYFTMTGCGRAERVEGPLVDVIHKRTVATPVVLD